MAMQTGLDRREKSVCLRRVLAVDSWLVLVAILALISLTLFSTLNLALRMPSRVRLGQHFDRNGLKGAAERFVALRPQYMLAAAVMQTASTLCLLLTVLYSISLSDAESTRGRIAMACGIALLLILIFGIAIPSAWAKYAGEWLIVRVLPLLSIVRLLCYPVIVVLELVDSLVRRLAGVPVRDAASFADELEQKILDAVSEGERHGAVDEQEKEMIESVIELTDTHVQEIMTPRTDVVALSIEADLETTLKTIRQKGHSRIPVYDGTIDTILGVLYAKDLLQRTNDESFDLGRAMRKVMFVPVSKLVRELLREFQQRKMHIAVVLDEYGGTAGLVTIEDILEELVGEITDEYETTASAKLERIDDQTVEVDARMRIDDLNDQLHIDLPEDEDYETIGGFVFSTLGKIPKVGECCDYNNIGIQVTAAEARRITRLRLKIIPRVENQHGGA